MYNCECPIYRKPQIRGRNTYTRAATRVVKPRWHQRSERPGLFDYSINGSYAGRYRTCY